MLHAYYGEMAEQRPLQAFRQHRDAITVALPTSHRDLVGPEVDILDPQAQRLEQSHPRPIQQLNDERRSASALQYAKHLAHFIFRQDDGDANRTLRSHQRRQAANRHLQHVAIQEQDRRKGLVLRRRADVRVDREIRQKPRDVPGTELARMASATRPDEPLHPLDVHFFRPWTVMPNSECPTQRGQKRRDSHAYSVTARLPLEGPQKRRPSDVRPSEPPTLPPRAASTPAHATHTTPAHRPGFAPRVADAHTR